jgi:predicted Zn-dependent peptidase
VSQVIQSHVFPNGLVLVAEPILSLESAAFTLLVPAGTSYEAISRAGLSGVTCEMTLRGAGHRDARKLVEDLENLGVERGESVADSHISYSGATLAKNLPAALAIYADILRRPQLPASQLEPVREAALGELQSVEDEPGHKVMLELRRRFYPQPWGRSSHGDEPGLSAMTLADVQAFHRQHFQPQGAILGVAGRVDWEALKDQVGQLLGDWPGQAALPVEEPTHPYPITHLHHDANQTQVGIAYGSVPYRHPDYFRASGAVGALSGGMSARLFTEVREKRGLCYSVYASYHTLRDRGGVLCYAGTSAERAQETLDVMLGELIRLADGITQQELDRLKARIKSGLIMQQESSSARSAAVARDWYHLGRVRTLDEIARLVDELSCDSINGYLRENPPRDFTVVTLGPQPLEVRLGVS